MRRLLYLLPLAVFAGIATYLAIGLGSDPRIVPSVLIDKPVPAFALPAVPGVPGMPESGLASGDLRGRITVVNVFASWCVPCLAEHSQITALAKSGAVRVVGLNYKDEAAAARAWLERHGNPFSAIGADKDGRVSIDWGVYGVPETFIVDAKGRIRYKHVGPITPDALKTAILPAIEEAGR